MASESRRPATARTDLVTGPPPPDLALVVAGGVLWKGLSRAVSGVTRVVLVVVLARLLTPTDYGLAGMAMVVTWWACSSPIPRSGPRWFSGPRSTSVTDRRCYWLAAGIGGVLTIVGIAASGLVADLFGEPQVQDLFIVTSFSVAWSSRSRLRTVPCSPASCVHAERSRCGRWSRCPRGRSRAVAVAVAGSGPGQSSSTSSAYVVPRRRSSCRSSAGLATSTLDVFDRKRLAASRFAAYQMLSARSCRRVMHDLDKALVGRALGAAALGTYSLAYTAMRLPRRS